jgi:RNA polymerase sigma factor (sigma-70 family)
LPATDDDLLAACLRDDQTAWETLIDRYAALIFSIPLKYGLAQSDAADVFQAVCLVLFERLDTIRAPRGLAAWIITTASRQSVLVSRRRRRDQSRSAGTDSSDSGVPDPDLLPEEELLALERQRAVRAAVDELPARCRELIEALFSDAAQQQTYQQLASGLGVPMNSLGPTRALPGAAAPVPDGLWLSVVMPYERTAMAPLIW